MERIGFIPILFHLYARRGFEVGHDFVVNQVRMRVKAIGELAHQGRDDAHSHRECILQNCKAILGRGSILVHSCRGASLYWFLRQVLYLSFSFYQNINAPFIFSCFSVCVNDIIDVIQYSYGTEIHFTEAIL